MGLSGDRKALEVLRDYYGSSASAAMGKTSAAAKVKVIDTCMKDMCEVRKAVKQECITRVSLKQNMKLLAETLAVESDDSEKDDDDDEDLTPLLLLEDNATIKQYPIRQRNKNKQSYSPISENRNYQHCTTNINGKDTKIIPMSEDDIFEYMVGYIMIQQFNLKKV